MALRPRWLFMPLAGRAGRQHREGRAEEKGQQRGETRASRGLLPRRYAWQHAGAKHECREHRGGRLGLHGRLTQKRLL